jgi:hypothetical protein
LKGLPESDASRIRANDRARSSRRRIIARQPSSRSHSESGRRVSTGPT